MATDLRLPNLEPIIVVDVEDANGRMREVRADLASLGLALRIALDNATDRHRSGRDGSTSLEAAASREPPTAVASEAIFIADPGGIRADKRGEDPSLFRRLYLDTIIPLLLVLVLLGFVLVLIG